jgi:hypothetical protein
MVLEEGAVRVVDECNEAEESERFRIKGRLTLLQVEKQMDHNIQRRGTKTE